jgi:glucose/arabinose dehydrogenase
MKLFLVLALSLPVTSLAAVSLEKIKLPPGFKIEVFATVPGARSLAMAPSGTVFVGSRGLGDTHSLYRIKNSKVDILTDKYSSPNGVAFKDGKLYLADIEQIIEFQDPENKSGPELKSRVLAQKFPSDTHHGWKYIRFGPDGKLYVPVGAPCNVCDPKKDYGRLYKIDVQGTSKEVVAEGIRNTVGFDFHPITKELWFTDNGRDLMGDDTPPDELNHITKPGQHFGFPYCFGKSVQDPAYKDKKCADFTPPDVELRAHVAALGMRFYTGTQFPAEYKNAIFLAEHGSWNRSKKQGYRLTLVRPNNKGVLAAEPFAEGWLQGNDAWGRPVDVEIYKDGSLLVSDDEAGVIYRIYYSKPSQ